MSRRPGIRGLLLAVHAFVLAVPLLAIIGLRVFDDQLIRRTESRLIGQSVLIAEAWREAWLQEVGISSAEAPRYAPIEADDDAYFPIEPALRLDQGVLDPLPPPSRSASDRSGPAWRAGARVEQILTRAVRMNLSSARVLDERGCIVASSGAQLGDCLDQLPEVREALAGRYSSALRRRTDETSPPPLESISRRGRVRVHTAVPILSDGRVIGAVWMARTALDPAKALWFDRGRLGAALGLCALLTAGLSLFLSRHITRPLQAITGAARSIARGEGRAPFDPPALAPEELHDLSRALDQMTGQLSDRAEYISDFAANVSHELKTPIAAIRGAAELLGEQWREMKPEERELFLGNIEDDAERMQRLVTRLLQLARIQSAPEFAGVIDLKSFLTDVAESYGDSVRLELGELPDELCVQPDHLESALRNLLENAIRHGSGATVDLEADQRGGRVSLRVRDRGPGISPGNRDRVFDRFFTTERERGGTGLGLAIARAVAETRGGRLDFETGPQGTCFELVL